MTTAFKTKENAMHLKKYVFVMIYRKLKQVALNQFSIQVQGTISCVHYLLPMAFQNGWILNYEASA